MRGSEIVNASTDDDRTGPSRATKKNRLVSNSSDFSGITDVLGYPVDSVADIPRGEYWVQAVLHRYETFHRSDGHRLKLPINRDEGIKWNRAPGNLYSTPRKVRLDAGEDATIEIRRTMPMDQEIPPIPEPEDTKYVKHVRFESALLSEFWGRPMYLDDTIVLLPEAFDEHPEARYPLVVSQGHYRRTIAHWRETPPEDEMRTADSEPEPAQTEDRPKVEPIRAALRGQPWVEPIVGYRNHPSYKPTEERYAYQLYKDWTGPGFPRVIKVDVQAATPYYDGSYGVNSANNGPYGDAVTYELIAFIEKTFRGIGEGWARVLYGGSTGGWTSLAFQVFYPDEYNGTWSACPSPVDFRAYTSVNIYQDENAFRIDSKWKRTPRPGLRNFLGDISCTLKELYRLERVLGTRGRSGELRDGYEAAWAPVGEDGYIKTLIDKRTGAIDPSVAEYMKEHYDLRHILERDWKETGRSSAPSSSASSTSTAVIWTTTICRTPSTSWMSFSSRPPSPTTPARWTTVIASSTAGAGITRTRTRSHGSPTFSASFPKWWSTCSRPRRREPT